MSHFLPPHVMARFAPNPPLPYRQPPPKRKAPPKYDGVAQYIDLFKSKPVPPVNRRETPKERRQRREAKRKAKAAKRLEARKAAYHPRESPPDNWTENALKTIFVGRLSTEVDEARLREEFEYYGAVSNVVIVRDKEGKHQGYGFVEFERTKSFTEAVRDADGRKLKGKRILVDIERGRTVKDWLPRRLGGGLGGLRNGKPVASSGRVPEAESQWGSSSRSRSRRSRSRGRRRSSRRSRSRSGSRSRHRYRSRRY